MNSKEFIEGLSASTALPVKETQNLMNDFVEEFSSLLEDSSDIVIHGFGTFEVKKKKERIIINPSTGKKMLVPPKLSVGFKISSTYKNKMK